MARSGTWILVGNLKNDRGWLITWLRVQPLDGGRGDFGGKL